MRRVSIETEISSKVKEKKIAPTGPQSVHGREVGEFNKKEDHESESNAQTFHSCKVIHHIAFIHCIRCMFSYLKLECRVKKRVSHPTKALERPSKRKKAS